MKNFAVDCDILIQIRHLNKCLKNYFDKQIESFGLTGQQGRILFYVNRTCQAGVDVHQNDLEKWFGLSKSSVSEMVSRMEASDLLQRKAAKPQTIIVPTEKGKSIVDAIFEGRTATIQKLLKGFSEDEKNKLEELVTRMIQNLVEEEETCGEKLN